MLKNDRVNALFKMAGILITYIFTLHGTFSLFAEGWGLLLFAVLTAFTAHTVIRQVQRVIRNERLD
ncbi:hypothetical protein [Salimicrobium halophilum]|uniref:Uncharacterized protein n=1 Tax=Salimicrobium halophilum TaxID=86666 RepID=A0A1G8R7T3_9BACI|nr:hypothetical protein [Salimicrobium halophilum]SDJ12999.1 hypothetical protein SAMN04490247_0880 [Salimicrobium halophilum]